MSKDIYGILDQLLEDLSEDGQEIEKVDTEQIEYLINQGYVCQVSSKYFLSLTGKLFVADGGYRNQRKKERVSRNFQIGFWASAILNFLLTIILVIINIQQNQDRKGANYDNQNIDLTIKIDTCKTAYKEIPNKPE